MNDQQEQAAQPQLSIEEQLQRLELQYSMYEGIKIWAEIFEKFKTLDLNVNSLPLPGGLILQQPQKPAAESVEAEVVPQEDKPISTDTSCAQDAEVVV